MHTALMMYEIYIYNIENDFIFSNNKYFYCSKMF